MAPGNMFFCWSLKFYFLWVTGLPNGKALAAQGFFGYPLWVTAGLRGYTKENKKMHLRSYQQTLYDQTRHSFAAGHRRPLVVLPCGGGKSYLFAAMCQTAKHGQALILTHRRELKDQHEKLLAELGIPARVAMILTEANRLGQYEKPGLIITDEAHLSQTDSWRKVLDYYNVPVVGFTATPVRLDGKPLGDVYDDLITGVSVRYLIDHRCLAPFEYYAPVAADTDGLRTQRGDYIIADMEQLMTDRAIYSDVLKSWERLAGGEKTICYCVSIRHAQETAELFRSAGYTAAAIDSRTPEKERQGVMEDFRRGEITVLCNVGIISEGVSINDVTCCLLLRPTMSHALYWQQAMRCMRYQPGKTAKILDCVGNYARNPLPDSDVTWSLTEKRETRPRLNDRGDFAIRTCPKCFKVFKTAPVCPYCGAEYPLHPREVEAHREIELRRINEREALKAEQDEANE